MRIVVGVGARAGATYADLRAAVDAALAEAGIVAGDVTMIATVDRRADAVRGLASELGWPLRAFSAADLAAQPVPHPSGTVGEAVGTPSVAEAAALLAAGDRAEDPVAGGRAEGSVAGGREDPVAGGRAEDPAAGGPAAADPGASQPGAEALTVGARATAGGPVMGGRAQLVLEKRVFPCVTVAIARGLPAATPQP